MNKLEQKIKENWPSAVDGLGPCGKRILSALPPQEAPRDVVLLQCLCHQQESANASSKKGLHDMPGKQQFQAGRLLK